MTSGFVKTSLNGAVRVVLILLVAGIIHACGSDTTPDGNESADEKAADEKAVNAIGDRIEISAWTRPNSEFTYQEFIDVGWKQHQIYDVATLPSALEARYGFFKRRDVEIRRYPTHADAMGAGVDSAEEALDRTVHDGSGFASRRVYGGYLVVGNLLMMCEVSTQDCLGLIAAVEGANAE